MATITCNRALYAFLEIVNTTSRTTCTRQLYYAKSRAIRLWQLWHKIKHSMPTAPLFNTGKMLTAPLLHMYKVTHTSLYATAILLYHQILLKTKLRSLNFTIRNRDTNTKECCRPYTTSAWPIFFWSPIAGRKSNFTHTHTQKVTSTGIQH